MVRKGLIDSESSEEDGHQTPDNYAARKLSSSVAHPVNLSISPSHFAIDLALLCADSRAGNRETQILNAGPTNALSTRATDAHRRYLRMSKAFHHGNSMLSVATRDLCPSPKVRKWRGSTLGKLVLIISSQAAMRRSPVLATPKPTI